MCEAPPTRWKRRRPSSERPRRRFERVLLHAASRTILVNSAAHPSALGAYEWHTQGWGCDVARPGKTRGQVAGSASGLFVCCRGDLVLFSRCSCTDRAWISCEIS